jgi:hypothetical protein
MTFKRGDGVLLECDGEKWLAEIALISKNGKSVAVTFNGMVHGHVGMMPLLQDHGIIYRSIIDQVAVTLKPLPKDWLTRRDIIKDK